MADQPSGIDQYLKQIRDIQDRVFSQQRPLLHEVARQMALTILGERRIFVFGTGHSHLLAEEGYCRAGGLASVVPIFYTALMLHEDIPLSARIERTPGLAGMLLDRAGVQAGDMLFVYSNSGVNHLPVEMALEGRSRGLKVVTVSSAAFAEVAPLSEIGKRLSEVADFAIDNGGVPGDGLVELPGLEWRVGPSSTAMGAMIWNSLVVETSRLVQLSKGDAPVNASQNMPGAQEQHRKITSKWKNIAPNHF
jgi:uncharacterized phosphosugar-binding protein